MKEKFEFGANLEIKKDILYCKATGKREARKIITKRLAKMLAKSVVKIESIEKEPWRY